jgi:SSS family solute:Na+ symporter
VNTLDWIVLAGSILGIAAYGLWRTRGRRDLQAYLHGDRNTPWIVIGLSVMATQASAVTFLSTPGQGYQGGLRFVQNYFGAPFALIIVAAVFLPYFRRLKVHTAYEYLGQRFDAKTRLLGAGLFLVQRGLAAGLTIYAPAIVMSTVMGWRLDLTIVCTAAVAIIYTVAGGSQAVNLTQKYQLAVIFAGMAAAFVVLLGKLPANVNMSDALTIAGGFDKLEAVDFRLKWDERYTFWSGLVGGMFLALSYFGTDQSQVQRYLSGSSIRESRLGLMFNAVCKIPMQFFILLLGVMVFVFYQFETPPLHFDQSAWNDALQSQEFGGDVRALEQEFLAANAEKHAAIGEWLAARHADDAAAAQTARARAVAANQHTEDIRTRAQKTIAEARSGASANDVDYVFITFVTQQLPHGLIGLMMAAFCCATLQSKSAELNALASTTMVDVYRHTIYPGASDAHCVRATRWFTVMWGLVALSFALFANMVENLIQAVNIVGSVFYGVPLGLFLVAFFLPWVRGTAVFCGAIAAQALIFVLYSQLGKDYYLWYNVIGAAACLMFSVVVQAAIDLRRAEPSEEALSP